MVFCVVYFGFCAPTLEVIGSFTIPSVYGLRRKYSPARYNVTSASRASPLKVFAMWYTWTTLLLVSCALVEAEPGAEVTTEAASVATRRAPPRTLDRKAAELAWRSWLQSPESVNPNAPPRRITTKSLFIPPLVCPKGQRLDRNGCVEVVTIDKTEHERILLEQLNAQYNPTPNSSTGGDVLYDYDFVDEPGPLQLSIPIGLDPLAAPLRGQEQADQALETQSNQVKVDKKDVVNGQENGAGIEAELELMKLQNSLNAPGNKPSIDATDILNHNVLINAYHYPDKPKRDSVAVNSTETETIINTADEGQKEVVFGHVNVDPITYNTSTEIVNSNLSGVKTNLTTVEEITAADNNSSATNDNIDQTSSSSTQALNKGEEKSKLRPENDYSEIGEAIKLISRYADVTTDDNFTKDDNKGTIGDEPILGTRTKLQYRRKKPQFKEIFEAPAHVVPQQQLAPLIYANNGVYYRYPLPNQNSPSPPPNYPFRHLQDYWPGQNHVGGVYNTHENPRRHHHSFPQNYRLHGYPHTVTQSAYPEKLKGYIHRVAQRRISPRSHNQELYSLLGLRHWFSSEGTSKR